MNLDPLSSLDGSETQTVGDSITAMAECIANDLRPGTVLVAARLDYVVGALVEVLRRRGIEAWGIWTAEDAVLSSLRTERIERTAFPYCYTGSLTAPFPEPKYDLIICFEANELFRADIVESGIANLCRHSDTILFSFLHTDGFYLLDSRQVAPEERSMAPLQTGLTHWIAGFAQCGFMLDIDFDPAFSAPCSMLFRHSPDAVQCSPQEQMVSSYQFKLWQLRDENNIRRAIAIDLKKELVQKETGHQKALEALRQAIADKQAEKDRLLVVRNNEIRSWMQAVDAIRSERDAILNSTSWRAIARLQRLRQRIIPVGSRRDAILRTTFRMARHLLRSGSRSLNRGQPASQRRIASLPVQASVPEPVSYPDAQTIVIDEIAVRPPISPHQEPVDIIICVQGGVDDDRSDQQVRQCLESLRVYTHPPYHLILVDDGSAAETHAFLSAYAEQQRRQGACTLIRNEVAKGYPSAVNQGLHTASAEIVILLSSAALVTPGWVDRMVACAQSDAKIGVVGPLSNAAGEQSVLVTATHLEWAGSPLPAGISPAEVGLWVAEKSHRFYPRLPLLDGFCLLLRRQLLDDLGDLDEADSAAVQGADVDYCLRAQKAGWQLALADDAYVYLLHRRGSLGQRNTIRQQVMAALGQKHGPEGSEVYRPGLPVIALNQERLIRGIRARARHLRARQVLIERGRERFTGKRILFVLPVAAAGGGASVILLTAKIMRQMGIDAQIYNLTIYRQDFERAYPADQEHPEKDVPIVYGEIAELPEIAMRYDAAVATSYITVYWLSPLASLRPELPIGYYIQDYEPYFDELGSEGYQKAADSYTLLPNLVRGCTTRWIYDQIQAGLAMANSPINNLPSDNQPLPTPLIGACFDADLFVPRSRRDQSWPDRPLRIAAMIRPSTPRRNPSLTMEVLQRASREFGCQVEFVLFGADLQELHEARLPMSFPFKLAGRLGQKQVANLLNEVDIFLDFSTFQALGITALEALSCGVATVVPQNGGSGTFARHEENCLVVDSHDPQACFAALQRLVIEHDLRARLQLNGLDDAPQYYPDLPTFKLLEALFGRGLLRTDDTEIRR